MFDLRIQYSESKIEFSMTNDTKVLVMVYSWCNI